MSELSDINIPRSEIVQPGDINLHERIVCDNTLSVKFRLRSREKNDYSGYRSYVQPWIRLTLSLWFVFDFHLADDMDFCLITARLSKIKPYKIPCTIRQICADHRAGLYSA